MSYLGNASSPNLLTGDDVDPGFTLPGTAGTPAGAVMFFAMSTAPAGWLECNGATVSRAGYANLYAAIGNTYGAGDGATTFSLPDCRGEFLRGWDNGRLIDSGRAFGSVQGDAVKTSPGVTLNSTLGTGASAFTTGTQGTVSGGTETRPRNIAFLCCIKY